LTDDAFPEDLSAVESTPNNLTPNPSVVSQQTNDGAVLLEMTTGECYELNRVGAEIWAGLAKGDSLSGIVATLSRRYEIPLTTIEADALSLIDDLRTRGLLSSR
jgi:hypothetical protein